MKNLTLERYEAWKQTEHCKTARLVLEQMILVYGIEKQEIIAVIIEYLKEGGVINRKKLNDKEKAEAKQALLREGMYWENWAASGTLNI